MKTTSGIGLQDVQAVYSGPEGELWELVMGQQIHLGGFQSSMELAEKAGIGPGMAGVDLCCCNGAGMRVLVRFRNVRRMCGVDATEAMIQRGRCRTEAEGLSDRITFVLADVTRTGLGDGSADFVWGEDAWCYVEDKGRLIAEAARLVRTGGIIAFTDWIEGPPGLAAAEAERFLRFMKFPGVLDQEGYVALLADHGCEVLAAEDTGRFAPCVDLYLDMLSRQCTYDALRILNFDRQLMEALGGEMQFVGELAHAGKIRQGRFIARKRDGTIRPYPPR
ncbi:MAG: class I SAM-dependent methyltransferase [Thermoguttaceae bacterium]|jgi:SAM-dependent methyltransferase